MAVETEIKLTLSPRAATALVDLPLLAGIMPLRQKLLNTYYDTRDLRLQRERVAVRLRRKGWEWLLTVKCATPSIGGLARRNEWEAPGLPGDFDFSHVDDRKLRHRLESLRGELETAFTTNFTRTVWLLDGPAGSRVELALDRGWIEAGGRKERLCELELELLSGETGALFTLASQLQDELGNEYALHPEPASKAERGYRLSDNSVDATRRAARSAPIVLNDAMSGLGAFRTVAISCLAHLQSNEEGVCKSDAPEFVHQARVAIRRLRSAMRAWKPILPEDFVIAFDPRWRALASTLSETRNCDVLLNETLPPLARARPGDRDLARLIQHAQRRRTESRRNARTAFQAVAYSRLLLEFGAAVLTLPELHETGLPSFAHRSLNKRARKIADLVDITRDTDAASLHRLRIAFKRLRYVLEFFSALYPQRHIQRYYLATTQLQDILGQLNDLVVARHFVDAALPARSAASITDWIEERRTLLLVEMNHKLSAFLKHKAL